MELLIYTRRVTPRVEYIFRFIFKDILRLNYRITTSITEANSYYGPILSYSHQQIGKSVQIIPHGLLTEDGIKHHSFEVIDWKGIPAFPLTAPDTETPFDIFSASFYLITRYEEYPKSISNLDKHSRFCSRDCLASKNKFLNLPVVDLWAFRLLEILKAKNYSLSIKPRKFNQITTIDLDSAYAFKHKGIIRVLLSAFKSVITNGKPDFIKRFKVLTGLEADPFDIYSNLFTILPCSPQTIWFVHAGKWGKYDKPIPISTPAMKALVGTLAEKYRVGIHPSYSSFMNEHKTREELADLVNALDQAVACSRQHYIRLRLPASYRILTKMGITEDYSMGYPDTVGFRAGTCTPFVFYDLISEQPVNLKVFPFQVMDSIFVNEKISPEKTREIIFGLIEAVRRVNGTFISVWHVDYLSGYGQSDGWFSLLKDVLNDLNLGNSKNSSVKND